MGRRRRASKTSDLGVLVLLGAGVYFGYRDRFSDPVWILFGVTVLSFWVSFLMPTKCDYRTQRGKPCDRGVRGKLRGCRTHGRWKRDAVFQLFGMVNPGARLRTTWSSVEHTAFQADGTRAGPESVPVERQRPPVPERTKYDVGMFIFTAMGAIASTVALFS